VRRVLQLLQRIWRIGRPGAGDDVAAYGRNAVTCMGAKMKRALQAFLDSVNVGSPPINSVLLIHAIWHGLRGECDAAHKIAQEDASADGAWVHAWLHRVEGDLSMQFRTTYSAQLLARHTTKKNDYALLTRRNSAECQP
jgi:hypothetical protein